MSTITGTAIQPATTTAICTDERHGMYDLPSDWCADCREPANARRRQASIQRRPSKIILSTVGLVEATPFVWYPNQLLAASLPRSLAYLHLALRPGRKTLLGVIRQLPNLQLLEAPPSMESLFDDHGIRAACHARGIGIWLATIYDL